MPNIYRVRAASTGWTGGPGLNTFYFRQGAGTGAGDGGDAQLCADRVHAGFSDAAGLFPNLWSLQVDATVDYLNDVTGELVESFTVTPPALVVGTEEGGFNAIPAMVLLQLRTSTVVEGRRLMGRAFIGPVAGSADSGGIPSGLAVSQANAIGTALLDAGVAGPFPVVWHRPRVAVPTATPPVTASPGSSAQVIATTVPSYFAVLRSRRD